MPIDTQPSYDEWTHPQSSNAYLCESDGSIIVMYLYVQASCTGCIVWTLGCGNSGGVSGSGGV